MKICIVNAHWSNRGDEAALRPIINELLHKYKNSSIRVIFKDDKEVQGFPYYERVTCFSAKFLPRNFAEFLLAVMTKGRLGNNASMTAEIREICDSDAIIYAPGGAVICDRFWWRKQLEYLLPFACAKRNHIPLVVAAPSVGPFEKFFWRNIVRKWLMKEAERFCVREKISEKYLRSIGLYKNVVTTTDTAFYDMPNQWENERILKEYEQLNTFLQSYRKVIGMTLSDFTWHVEYTNKKDLIEKAEDSVRKFIQRRQTEGIGILLIPQLFGNQNDSEYLKEYKSDNLFILSDEYDTYFQQYVISKLYAHVGMRYHSNIFAAKAGIPFIGIVYEEKMQGFMDMWNLNRYAIRLEDLSAETLEERWDMLCREYSEYQLRLSDNHKLWKKKAAVTIKAIHKVISAANLR